MRPIARLRIRVIGWPLSFNAECEGAEGNVKYASQC